VITWKQAFWLGVVLLASGAAVIGAVFLMMGCVILLGGGGSVWSGWLRQKSPALGRVAGWAFYGIVSALILVFWAAVVWYSAWDMASFALASPGKFVIVLLLTIWFPLAFYLVVLAKAIWRGFRTGPTRIRSLKEIDVVDAEFEDLEGPPRQDRQ
jgi:hypothetical protein